MTLWRPIGIVLYLYPGREELKYGSLGLIFSLSLSLLQLSSANPVYEKFYRQVCIFLLKEQTLFCI